MTTATLKTRPALLRELGWLRDQDEFRRQAAWRFTAVFAGDGRDTSPGRGHGRWPSSGWCGFFGALFEYWGARRAVSSTLFVMGAFWLLFNVLGNLTDPVALLLQSLTAAPFLGLGWLCRRWPRVAGALLLVCGVASVVFFKLDEAITELRTGAVMVFLLFSMPLLAGGVGLLRGDREADA